jgi:hypothetical protein
VQRARPDLVSLVAGGCLIALGAVLLLDQLGEIELDFAAVAPMVVATLGAILLASGLARGR